MSLYHVGTNDHEHPGTIKFIKGICYGSRTKRCRQPVTVGACQVRAQ